MALLVWCVMVLSLYFAVSHGTQVQWSVSLPGKCVTNDTVMGICTRSRTVPVRKDINRSGGSGLLLQRGRHENLVVYQMRHTKMSRSVVSSACGRHGNHVTACALESLAIEHAVFFGVTTMPVTCPPLLEKNTCAQCAGNANDFYFWNVNDWGACRAFTTSTVYELSANQSRLASAGNDVCGPNFENRY